MIGAVLFGAMLGSLVATPFIFAFYDQQPGESAWQWLVFGPFIFIGGVFGFRYWRMVSGADAYFDEGFSMRAIARVFGAGLTLARVDKPLKEEAVGCQV